MDKALRFSTILIALFIMVVYSNTFWGEFHLEDEKITSDVIKIRDLPKVIVGLSHKAGSVTELTFALNYKFDGYNVWGYHLINILLHTLTTFTLFLLIRLLFSTPAGSKDEEAGEYFFIAFFASAAFAMHPAHTEAVSYIIQRYTLMGALFYLASMALYIKYRLTEGNGKRHYAFALIAAFIAAQSHDFSITLPVALLLLEFLFFPPFIPERKRLLPLAPFVVIALASLLRSLATGTLETAGFLAKYHAIWYYLKFSLWPSGLSILHDFPAIGSVTNAWTISAYVFALCTGLLAFKVRVKHPVFAFGLLFFLLTPLVSIFQSPSGAFSDHFLYLSSTGLILAVSYATLSFVARRLASFEVGGGVLMMATIILGLVAYERNALWSTQERIWRDAAEKNPKSVTAVIQLGQSLINNKQIKEGCEFIARAYTLDKNSPSTLLKMGNCQKASGNKETAEAFYIEAAKLTVKLKHK